MVWKNVHPDAPTDDDGHPRHPETGAVVCGYPKTDATANNGRKREDIPYCLLQAGWGSPRDTGHCRNHGGGSPGAPEGWSNGNAKHLLYSKRMNDEDREVFDALVKNPDGDGMLRLEDAVDMLKNIIAWEQTRIVRALREAPESELVERWACPECDERHREPAGECGGIKAVIPDGGTVPCRYEGDFDRVEAFVKFGDKAIERKESHLANLIRTAKQVDPTAVDANIASKQDVDVTHKGDPDDPVEVDINHVHVDLPDDERVDVPSTVEEADGE